MLPWYARSLPSLSFNPHPPVKEGAMVPAVTCWFYSVFQGCFREPPPVFALIRVRDRSFWVAWYSLHENIPRQIRARTPLTHVAIDHVGLLYQWLVSNARPARFPKPIRSNLRIRPCLDLNAAGRGNCCGNTSHYPGSLFRHVHAGATTTRAVLPCLQPGH